MSEPSLTQWSESPRGRRRMIIVAAALGLGCASWMAWLWHASHTADRLLQEGRGALARGEAAQAVDCAEQALRYAPRFSPARRLLAEAALLDGRDERALTALDEYSRERPDDAGKLGLSLGTQWMKQNRTRPALTALRLAEKLQKDALPSLQLQEQIAAVTGYSRELVRCILELLKRDTFTRGDMLLITSLSPGLGDLPRLEAILAADPENKAPLLAKARSELHRNHPDSAEQLLREITAAHPEETEPWMLLAELYAAHLPEKFPAWHAELPDTMRDDALAWSARGKWLSQAGFVKPAIRCLHEALAREPEQLTTTTLLGQLLKSQGEAELGTALIERARRLQRISDLNGRLNEPRANEFVLPMIEELEATGRLWEAWGWCGIQLQTQTTPNPALLAIKERLEAQLTPDLPRTKPGSLPGEDFDWERFPLPNWADIQSSDRAAPPVAATDETVIRFEDSAAHAGLDFRTMNSYSPEAGRKIFETTGTGVAVLDFDGDGWPDLYFPQGAAAPNSAAQGPSDQLYRNVDGLRFENVTSRCGVEETSYSQGVAAGDFDNDGFADIYVANFGRNRLFRNNGDGTFSDVTEQAGLRQESWTSSCAIADLNGDGLPELFDVNYAQGRDVLTRTCQEPDGRKVVCRPTLFDAAMDTVAVNLGDGRFQEQRSEAGLDLPQGMGLGLVVADFNADDRLDVFVANDMTANHLLMNEQSGPNHPLRFRDEALVRGVAFDRNGLAQACMGVGCGDLNRDGSPDLYVTNFAQESNTAYLSTGDGSYEDRTQEIGLREPSFDPLGFGTQFLDADNDGWPDLAVVNGHIDEFQNEPYRMKAQVFRGLPNGRFVELFAPQAGELFDKLRLGRGMALLDWNRNGLIDFVATDLEAGVLLAENRSATSQQALRIRLIGTESSRDAIGAKLRVTVSPGDERFAQVTAGDGYESSNERMIHIGVGASERIAEVEIRWPSGRISRTSDISPDRAWLAIENREDWLPLSAPTP